MQGKQLNLSVFPKGYFDKYLPKGAELQELFIEDDGTFVGYGNPELEHNCDEMGCPTIAHVVFILQGQGVK